MAIHVRTKIVASFSIILVLLSILGFIAYYNRNLLYDNLITVDIKEVEDVFQYS